MNLGRTGRPLARALVAALCLSASTLQAQGSITGRITAAGTGLPVASAHVIAIGTPSTAVSGQDGKYTLKHLAPGTVVVQVIQVGFTAQKKVVAVEAGGSAKADFDLAQTVVNLGEVVTTGVGERRGVELGFTATDLGDIGARMERSPTNLTISDLLVQKVPSGNILGQGMVGTGASIRFRQFGSLTQTNEPLVLVDGIRISTSATSPGGGVGGTQSSLLNSFSPEEIDNIQVLPGPAATSVYGTNAANGVILVTTKRGRVSDAKWTWTTEQGRIQDQNDYPASYAIWGHAPSSTAAVRCLLPTMGPTTCIQDSVTSLNILKTSALTPVADGNRSLYGMQVGGGTEVVRYYASANVENATGPIQMPDFSSQRLDSILVPIRGEWKHPEAWQRENFRTNVNATLTPNLDMGVQAGFMKSDQRLPQTDNSPVGIFAAARESPGFAHPGLGYSNIGSLGENLHGYNGWVPSEMFQDFSNENIQRETMSFNTNWRPYSWMANDGWIGVDYGNYTDFNVCRLNECPNYTSPGGIALRNGQNFSATYGSRVVSGKLSSVSTWNPRAGLNLKTTFGTEYINVESDASVANGLGLPPGAQNVGQAATRTQASSLIETVGKTLGVYAQSQASMRDDRLFLGLGVRFDQNSAFGQKILWASYPSVSASWLLSDEKFFKKPSWLDQLRLRGAYGSSGRQPPLTGAFKAYRPDTASIGGTDTPGLTTVQAGNVNLKPERTGEMELGFDSKMLKDRLSLELTYYNRKTGNAIVQIPIAASAGSSLSTFANVGDVGSNGLEAVVTTQLIDRRALSWDMTITASHGSNTVNAVGPTGPIINGNTRMQSGYPVDALFYRNFSFADANGDGRIQPSEVTVDTTMRFQGYQVPRDLASIQNGIELFSHKLRLTAMFDYKGGHSVFDASSAFLCANYLSCADESNPSASLSEQARAVAARYGTPEYGSTYTTPVGYLSNGGFWRLREVSATWTLPSQFTSRVLRASNASINFGARNLHVWSSYKGLDPEANYGAGDLQTDFMTAGPPRYYTLRLNLHY